MGSQRFWGDESTYTARNTKNLIKIATGRLQTLSDNLRVHGQYEVLIKACQAMVAIVEFVKSCGFDNEGLAVVLDNQLTFYAARSFDASASIVLVSNPCRDEGAIMHRGRPVLGSCAERSTDQV